jgi:hypothetical protein
VWPRLPRLPEFSNRADEVSSAVFGLGSKLLPPKGTSLAALVLKPQAMFAGWERAVMSLRERPPMARAWAEVAALAAAPSSSTAP